MIYLRKFLIIGSIVLHTFYPTCFLWAYDYDLVIIGGGAAGICALRRAVLYTDKKIAIIEKHKIGGSRIWSGDIPTKTLISAANTLYKLQHISEYGLRNIQSVQVDISELMLYIRSTMQEVYNVIYAQGLLKDKQFDTYYGEASFINEHTLQIEETSITGNHFIIATGTYPKILPIKGLDSVPYFHINNFFTLDTLPESIIIIGGGPLGVELAGALNKLGVKVSLIMKYGMLLPTFDFEVVNELTTIMENQGIKVYCNSTPHEVFFNEETSKIILNVSDIFGKNFTLKADALFFALKAVPNLESLTLENAGIVLDNNMLYIDSQMRTNISHIYACGDVVGGLHLLHRVAYYQAKTAVHNIFNDDKELLHIDYNMLPRVLWTTIPLAAIGLNEQDARKKYGDTIRVYTIPYRQIERSYIDNSKLGVGKFICDKEGKLLGATVLGKQAGSIIEILKIGEPFTHQLFQLDVEIKTETDYFDLINHAISAARKDFPVDKQEFSWWQQILNIFK